MNDLIISLPNKKYSKKKYKNQSTFYYINPTDNLTDNDEKRLCMIKSFVSQGLCQDIFNLYQCNLEERIKVTHLDIFNTINNSLLYTINNNTELNTYTFNLLKILIIENNQELIKNFINKLNNQKLQISFIKYIRNIRKLNLLNK